MDKLLKPFSSNTGQDTSFANLRTHHQKASPDLPYKEKIRQYEYKVFSQNGEDGLIHHIFNQIGTTNKTFVEFGVETGRECNAANLIIHAGWEGLMLDGSSANVESGLAYYRELGETIADKVQFSQCFVTTDNINETIEAHGIQGEIDLLSVDIDGNDYWLWNAIDVISPRVVVVEYNASFGANRSQTVCYDPTFTRFKKHKSGWYHGASLAAFTKLGSQKGYKLVAADSGGCNAFFVRKDIPLGDLQEIIPTDAYYPQPKRNRIASLEQQYSLIQHLKFEDI